MQENSIFSRIVKHTAYTSIQLRSRAAALGMQLFKRLRPAKSADQFHLQLDTESKHKKDTSRVSTKGIVAKPFCTGLEAKCIFAMYLAKIDRNML